ncbi:hypothetical protein KSP39_PZI023983 [Platanthera zijinensis]|uniref:Uncharacterized protein n=1 Tax=Platanthera zijinensis TaxID=2320716 RepID=A0AAP0AU11_9ASPA
MSLALQFRKIFSPVAGDRDVEVSEAIHPEIVIAYGKISEALSPSHGELQNCVNVQYCHIHQELSRSITEAKTYPDSPLHSISAAFSVQEDVNQKLETASVAHTPKSIAKSFHFSTPKSISNKQTEGVDIIKDLDCFGNVSCLMEVDKNATSENIDVSMQTPDNTAKIFQFPIINGSISSFQAKHRQPQYSSILSLNESLHTSATQLSASRKMEFIKHGERLSSIKSSISRSRFNSVSKTDCEATSSKKDLFITDFQGSLNETNNDSRMKDSGISEVNIDASKFDADKQIEGLTVFDKNVSFIGTVENGQSRGMKLYCDNSLELLRTLDTCASSIDQSVVDLNESKQELNSSRKYAPANKNKSAISSEGCVTPGDDEMNKSSYLLHESLQPAISLECPSEKVNNGKNSLVSLNSSNLVHHLNDNEGLESFHAVSLYTSTKLNEFSANNIPKKNIESSINSSYCK